jgi:cytochrome c-type biogenesis protein CcmI
VSIPVMAAAAVVTLVSLGFVLRPVYRASGRRIGWTEGVADDRRAALARRLADLEDDRLRGALEAGDYAWLREEIGAEAVAADEAAPGGGDSPARPRGAGWSPRAGRRAVPAFLAAALIVAAGIPLAASHMRDRVPPRTIGGAGRSGEPGGPHSVAERLALARRDMDAGRFGRATRQYLAVLRVRPNDGEARSSMALLLFRAGLVRQALASVDRALDAAPGYAEAHFVKGVILFMGERRPKPAAAQLRAYLRQAPFGSKAAEARKLLAATRALGGR